MVPLHPASIAHTQTQRKFFVRFRTAPKVRSGPVRWQVAPSGGDGGGNEEERARLRSMETADASASADETQRRPLQSFIVVSVSVNGCLLVVVVVVERRKPVPKLSKPLRRPPLSARPHF